MANLNGFDANTVEPADDLEPIPSGKYVAVITDSEMKPTKSGTGNYLQLTFQIVEGEYANRLLWVRLNLDNPNATAVEIARRELSAICRSVGVLVPTDSADLHNLPCVIHVRVKRRNDTGELQNEVKGYSKKDAVAQPIAASQVSGTDAPLETLISVTVSKPDSRPASQFRSAVFLSADLIQVIHHAATATSVSSSVNRYWRHVGTRVLVSKEGREYRQTVRSLMKLQKVKKHDGDLIVDIRLIPVDRRRRDVDNSLKALLDAMQAGGAYDDDSQIVRLTVEKFEPEADCPRTEVIVRRLPAKLGAPGYRICLRCDDEFYSLGPGNRLCEECTRWRSRLTGFVPIARGRKYRNGARIA